MFARGVPTQLDQIQNFELVEVGSREHLLIWNELLISEHPQRDAGCPAAAAGRSLSLRP